MNGRAGHDLLPPATDGLEQMVMPGTHGERAEAPVFSATREAAARVGLATRHDTTQHPTRHNTTQLHTTPHPTQHYTNAARTHVRTHTHEHTTHLS